MGNSSSGNYILYSNCFVLHLWISVFFENFLNSKLHTHLIVLLYYVHHMIGGAASNNSCYHYSGSGDCRIIWNIKGVPSDWRNRNCGYFISVLKNGTPGSPPSGSDDLDLLPCGISLDFPFRSSYRGLNVTGTEELCNIIIYFFFLKLAYAIRIAPFVGRG